MTDSRESALALLERTRKDYLAKARRVAAQIAYTTQQPVCVDDVRALCPPPESIDPRVMGAIFNRSDWEAVEFINSHRRTCHKRPIRRFVLRDGDWPRQEEEENERRNTL